MRITKTYRFEASHVLPHHEGKCSRLHGHSYRMDVTISGPLIVSGAATGMVMDFSNLSDVVKGLVIDALDHTHLNDCIENPTCENLLVWMWSRLAAPLPGLDEIEVWETASARASLRREDAEAQA